MSVVGFSLALPPLPGRGPRPSRAAVLRATRLGPHPKNPVIAVFGTPSGSLGSTPRPPPMARVFVVATTAAALLALVARPAGAATLLDIPWASVPSSEIARSIPVGCECVDTNETPCLKFECRCICDLTAGACDADCCCDAEVSAAGPEDAFSDQQLDFAVAWGVRRGREGTGPRQRGCDRSETVRQSPLAGFESRRARTERVTPASPRAA